MNQSTAAANAAFDTLVRAGKAEEDERAAFLYGFAAGITYATWLFALKNSGCPPPTPAQMVTSEHLRLEHMQ